MSGAEPDRGCLVSIGFVFFAYLITPPEGSDLPCSGVVGT